MISGAESMFSAGGSEGTSKGSGGVGWVAEETAGPLTGAGWMSKIAPLVDPRTSVPKPSAAFTWEAEVKVRLAVPAARARKVTVPIIPALPEKEPGWPHSKFTVPAAVE